MKHAILFGASGNLGREIATELTQRGFELSCVVRSNEKAALFTGQKINVIIADIAKPSTLAGICQGRDVVISALGKSVSPADKSKPSFTEVDLLGNSHILNEALKSGVKKMVYVSALHAERYPQLRYFNVHQAFSEKLKQSGIDYSIIKPPAIFSAYRDVIDLARKGRLVTIGKGEPRTNPIHEKDLAIICVDAIDKHKAIIEAGGKEVFTRRELNAIVQRVVDPARKVRSVPPALMKCLLPLLKLSNRNAYDKFAFFTEVMQHDTLAPQLGERQFEAYIRAQVQAMH